MRSGSLTATALATGLALIGLGCGEAGEDNGPRSLTKAELVAGNPRTDALVGTWNSGPVAMVRIRSRLLDAGYDAREIRDFLRFFDLEEATALESELSFYREVGEPFWAHRFWDAAVERPDDADHGPYEVIRGDRVVLTSADPEVNKYRYVFSYRVRGDELQLRVVSLENPGITPAQFRREGPLFHALAAARLQR
jgi:hypothetical protein